jgi:2,3-bisphosphoglycerate-dependent phosphoglycerate mutase
MEWFLIRHGQSLNNARPEVERVEDPPLTYVGHEQCARLAMWIRPLGLTRIVTSPFLRTLQTTDHISRSLRLMPEICVDLHEQGGCVSGPAREMFVGRPGMKRTEIESQFPGFDIPSELDGKGWWESKPFETGDLARKRASRILEQTIERFAETDERVAYVMHADIKRLVLAHLSDAPLETPHNTAVSKVSIRRGECHLEQYNAVEHLTAELITT